MSPGRPCRPGCTNRRARRSPCWCRRHTHARRGTASTDSAPRSPGSRGCTRADSRASPCTTRRVPNRPGGSATPDNRHGRSPCSRGCTGPSAPMPAFIPSSWRIGPLTTRYVANEVVLDWRPVMPVAIAARITGRCSGKRPRHHRVDGHLLDRELPRLAIRRRRQTAHDLIGRMGRCPSASARPAPRSGARSAGNRSSRSRETLAASSSSVAGSSSRPTERSNVSPARQRRVGRSARR